MLNKKQLKKIHDVMEYTGDPNNALRANDILYEETFHRYVGLMKSQRASPSDGRLEEIRRIISDLEGLQAAGLMIMGGDDSILDEYSKTRREGK